MLKLGKIVHTIKGVVETKVELVKFEIQEKFVEIIFRLLFLTFLIVLGLLVLLFFSFSLAFFLSQYTELPYMGFLLVGGLYLILFGVVYYLRYSEHVQYGIETGLRRFIFNKKKKKKDNEQ
jgi:cytochrome c biogenesis protein CcdA